MVLPKHIAFVATVVLLPLLCFSQNHHYESWTELGVSTEIYNDIDVYFVSEARLFNQDIRLKSISGDIGLSYKVSKELKIGLGHKLTQKNMPQGYFATNTSSANIQYKLKLTKHVKLSYRNKYEFSKSAYTNEASDLLYSFEDRNRVKLSYSRKKYKFSPSISVESFHPIEQGKMYRVSELRYGAGVNFDLKRKYEFELGYLHKQLFNNKVPESISIFTFALSKSF